MRPIIALGVMILAGGIPAGKALAAELEIAPVLLTLAPGQSSATILVRNNDKSPVAIQARAFAWTQVQDDDVLTPTQDIILSPPIFTVPAGASQTLRLLLRGGARRAAEPGRSYRLVLEEVPPAKIGNNGLVVVMRVSMPVFAPAAAQAPPVLTWRAVRAPDGQIVLTATNTGQSYTRVNAIAVTLSDGSRPRITARGKSPYILPGVQRHWTLQDSVGGQGASVRLKITTPTGATEEVLTP